MEDTFKSSLGDRISRAQSDPRLSSELITAALQTNDENERWHYIGILHARGNKEEFKIAKDLCASREKIKSILGIDILGQLGWSEKTFLEESVDILISFLESTDSEILYSASVALGHRGSARAIPHLISLTSHPEAKIRSGVVYGLLGHEDNQAIDTLIKLSADPDIDVRSWATFGLGSQIEADTPEINQVLLARASDKDDETRAEAILGLSLRKHPDSIRLVTEELKKASVGSLILEAAEVLGLQKV